MRTVLKLLLLLGITGYLIFVVIKFSTHQDASQCKSVNIVIADSAQATLITAADVEQMLRKHSLYPLGWSMKNISPLKIEQKLNADPFIEHTLCVKTPGQNVQVVVKQRLPLLRILSENGDDYYLDNKGIRMEARGYEADVAVVTGDVDHRFAKVHLVELGRILHNDPFWQAQIQQINVTPHHDIDMVMRVGDPIVHFGAPENFARKLRNLRAFYEKVLPQVGWHRYKEISVAYGNQVIGIKSSQK
jgi:putative cell division protein